MAEEKKPTEQEEVKEEKKETKKTRKKTDKTAELEQQLAEQKDLYLRLAAEYDNYRKRTQREKDALNGEIKVSVIGEFLTVLDNFERASSNADSDFDSYKKGIEMIFTQFGDILKKLGAESFGDIGDAFDPSMHNAVMHIESEDFGESTVAQVFAKGYKCGERIIRCATVQVAN
ncbi:MAG TPA: nucleotide exchange factor GrpE [Ruminococcaceae bacterium]|nr:nucleotide exchange factor GrpE [Oscillospiraceae bacterium]